MGKEWLERSQVLVVLRRKELRHIFWSLNCRMTVTRPRFGNFQEGTMRCIRPAFLFMAMAGSISLRAQTATPPPPQSARQALLEMLFGKGENDFKKHLPEDARQT